MPATVIPCFAQAVAQANDESFTQKLINSLDLFAAAARAKCATPSTNKSTRGHPLVTSRSGATLLDRLPRFS